MKEKSVEMEEFILYVPQVPPSSIYFQHYLLSLNFYKFISKHFIYFD